MRAKRGGNFVKLKFWKILHLSPKFKQVKVRLFIFFAEEEKLFIFSIFKVRIFISKKCQPPPLPSKSNGNPLQQVTDDSNAKCVIFL